MEQEQIFVSLLKIYNKRSITKFKDFLKKRVETGNVSKRQHPYELKFNLLNLILTSDSNINNINGFNLALASLSVMGHLHFATVYMLRVCD